MSIFRLRELWQDDLSVSLRVMVARVWYVADNQNQQIPHCLDNEDVDVLVKSDRLVESGKRRVSVESHPLIEQREFIGPGGSREAHTEMVEPAEKL